MRVSIVEIAIRQKITYRRAYEAALTGRFGPVEREGTRLYVVVDEPQRQPASAA